MKKFKKIICIILVFVFAMSVAASCGKNEEKTIVPDNKVEKEYADTQFDLVNSGVSAYKIVIPANADEMTVFAGEELKKYIAQATNCALEVISDSGLLFDEKGLYLSVGATSLLSGSGIKIDEKELNYDGFKVKTFGSLVVMAGGGECGTLYAVYEFLKINLKYQFFAPDETDYKTFTSVKVKDFDVTEVPDFANRTTYTSGVLANAEDRNRLRAHDNHRWGLFAHSYFKVLPPEIYYAEHKDWYYTSGAGETLKYLQLCVTNEEMRVEFVKELKKIILDKPDCAYFMVGQEDNNTFCNCPNCAASHAKFGGISGTMMRFVNGVARDIKAWQAADHIDRTIYIAAFAYQKTRPAPVSFDKTTGQYAPADPSVVAEDNVMIQYAPLEACFSHSLMAECNSHFRNEILGWETVTKNFAIWTYSTNFTNYLINFNNFSTIQPNYKQFKKMGTVVLMDQGAGETTATPFHDLRGYLHTQLMWDVDQDINKLTKDFIANYYKNAAPQITKYYNLIREHYATIEDDYKEENHSDFCIYIYNIYGNNIEQAKYWPKLFLEQCLDIYQEAYAEVEKIEDLALRNKIRLRVQAESLSTQYLLISLYNGTYDKSALSNMIDTFEEQAAECGLVCWKENTALTLKLGEWRTTLLK